MKTIKILIICLALVMGASAGFALDSKIVRDISRADSKKELLSLAEDVMKKLASVSPGSDEAAIRIAAEADAYMAYINLKLNAELIEKLGEEIEEGLDDLSDEIGKE